MSRSKKKTPITGRAACSAKQDKQLGNRKFRRKTKYSMTQYVEGDYLGSIQGLHPDDIEYGWDNFRFQELPWKVEEVYDEYNFARDGKFYGKFENWERK